MKSLNWKYVVVENFVRREFPDLDEYIHVLEGLKAQPKLLKSVINDLIEGRVSETKAKILNIIKIPTE